MAYNLRSRTVVQAIVQNGEEEEYGGAMSDAEEDHVSEHSDEDYETEDSNDEDAENAIQEQRVVKSRARGRPVFILRGKNGFAWNTRFRTRTSGRNVHEQEDEIVPGPKDEATNCNAPIEFWKILFNEDMLKVIVEKTNKKIEDVCAMMMATDYEMHTLLLWLMEISPRQCT